MVKKVMIPLELKYDFSFRGYKKTMKGFIYVIREKFGAAAALECIERFFKMDDRVKNLTNTLLTIFKIEGNDVETIVDFLKICGNSLKRKALGLNGLKQSLDKKSPNVRGKQFMKISAIGP